MKYECSFDYNLEQCNPVVVYNSMFFARFIIFINAFSHMAEFITIDNDFPYVVECYGH